MKTILILAFYLVPQISWSQIDSLSPDNKVDSILSLIYQLPPLEELLDNATETSYLVKSRDALIKIKENDLKKIKNDWLNILSFRGSLGYGNSIMDINQSNLGGGIASNVNTVLFNVGVVVSFTPEYWANRKHEVKILQAHIDYEKALRGEAKLTVAEKITDAYVKLEYYKNIYLKASIGFEANRSTLRIAKKRFVEGEIDIALYNDIVLKNIKLELEIEGYKQNLKKAYYNLQRLLPKN